jgi:hypothetical protein
MIWGNYRHNVNRKKRRSQESYEIRFTFYHRTREVAQVSPLPNAAIITT